MSEIVMSSWRSSTQAQYGSAWAKWSSWCVQRQRDPISCNLNHFLEFLAELFDAGLQYRTINVYRSAISVSHLPTDGCLLGSHPLVTRFMKSVYELRPPQPRIFNTWSVNTILLFLRSLHPSEDLPLKTLTFKFVMLSALVSAARSSYLHQFDLKFHHVKDICYYFIIPGLVKGSRPNKPHLEVCLLSFPEDPRLCIFTYCKEYIKRTQALRPRSSGKDPLFLSYTKPHRPVKTCSIAQWVKRVLSLSGIDTSHFTAHSTSSAATSSACKSGVSIADIMRVADWSQASTFKRFYEKPCKDMFALRILSSADSVEIRSNGNEEETIENNF